MKLLITKVELIELLFRQLNSIFGIGDIEKLVIQSNIDKTLIRCDQCFRNNPNKYYKKEGNVFFSPFHSVQYMTFLYFFANTISKVTENSVLCDKLYYLNKILNSVDIYYLVELPSHFMAEHPVGTVLGRAVYGDSFAFFQNCTVGGNSKEEYPVISANVTMFANSTIIGNSKIGENVFIGADACVKDSMIPSNSIVFGQSPNLIIKKKTNNSSGF